MGMIQNGSYYMSQLFLGECDKYSGRHGDSGHQSVILEITDPGSMGRTARVLKSALGALASVGKPLGDGSRGAEN